MYDWKLKTFKGYFSYLRDSMIKYNSVPVDGCDDVVDDVVDDDDDTRLCLFSDLGMFVSAGGVCRLETTETW